MVRYLARRLVVALFVTLFLASAAQAAVPPPPGGPILVVTSSDGFGRYLPEILRAEGLDEFSVADASQLSPGTLAGASVVLLGRGSLSAAQAATLGAWVNGGGKLVAMRPDPRLAGLLGLSGPAGVLSNAYLAVDTGSSPGAGITDRSMQFHGDADLYALNGARPIAMLHQSPSVAMANPAVTVRDVGALGGQAAAFTYDLARSVVYTRQGNPAWAGQERDGVAPIRADDMFQGWENLDNVAIPQADEQQRLLANLLTEMSTERAPLPRFWYLPRNERAAVVMTGDDHGLGGTEGQFATFENASPSGCSVADWQCIRATSYIYPGTPVPSAQAFVAAGFEIALHVDTNCADWTPAMLESFFSTQLQQFGTTLPSPETNRTHCVTWSDWDTQPHVELGHGIRLDTNYYYWPDAWINNRPGMYTGSGFPMRFATRDGALIDVYQSTTVITDESGQDIPFNIKTLLDRALGPEGFYGAFTVNMHTDNSTHPGAQAIVDEAKARGVPVISAKQLLDWADARNASAFRGLSFSAGGQLTFTLDASPGARGLQAMIPVQGGGGSIISLSRSGQPVSTTQRTVKGVSYLVFDATAGNYVATYPPPPVRRPPQAQAIQSPAPPAASTPRKPRAVRTVLVLNSRTKAPSFPRIRRSSATFRPGAGRLYRLIFRLPRSAHVTWTIRSAKGKVVRRIVTRPYKKGTVLQLRWDGKDSRGRYVAAGRYRFTVTASAKRYARTARGSVRTLKAR